MKKNRLDQQCEKLVSKWLRKYINLRWDWYDERNRDRGREREKDTDIHCYEVDKFLENNFPNLASEAIEP